MVGLPILSLGTKHAPRLVHFVIAINKRNRQDYLDRDIKVPKHQSIKCYLRIDKFNQTLNNVWKSLYSKPSFSTI